jgi:hypothetical protein
LASERLAILPGALLAAASATDAGQRWIDEHTTEAVMLGVGAVLLALRFSLDRANWRTVVRAFVYAGSPLVVRAVIRRLTS